MSLVTTNNFDALCFLCGTLSKFPCFAFQLSTPTGGWNRKSTHFVEGGDFGNREGMINELLKRMI